MNRNAGFSIEIGTEQDGAIVTAIATKAKLYFVKSGAIYSFRLADQIDPDRLNLDTPNTQQQELPIGSDDPVVARILLTAELLLKKTALGQSFDVERGIESALCLLRDIEALRGMRSRLEDAQREAEAMRPATGVKHSTLHLPSIQDIEARFDTFAQKVGHVVNGLEALARVFYPSELQSKWIDSLTRLVKEKYGQNSRFAEYMDRVGPFLLLMLKLRNMIEHPKPEEHIKVHNFRLLPTGELAPPSVEIVRPQVPVENRPVTASMEFITSHLVNVCEALLVNLCDANINAVGMLSSSLRVIQVPPDRRRHPEIRYSYGYFNGQTMVPISVS